MILKVTRSHKKWRDSICHLLLPIIVCVRHCWWTISRSHQVKRTVVRAGRSQVGENSQKKNILWHRATYTEYYGQQDAWLLSRCQRRFFPPFFLLEFLVVGQTSSEGLSSSADVLVPDLSLIFRFFARHTTTTNRKCAWSIDFAASVWQSHKNTTRLRFLTVINQLRAGLTVDSSQRRFLPTSKSRDAKTRPNIKSPAWSNVDYCALV